MKLRIGMMVGYRLNEEDVQQINRRRSDYSAPISSVGPGMGRSIPWPPGAQAHVGNAHESGQILPMMVVTIWQNDSVNGQVFLDGNDVLWATSVPWGSIGGTWCWLDG